MISRDAQAYVRQREQRLAESIDVVTEELSLKVGTDDVITAINASSEGISIDAKRININGVVSANGGFIVDEDGNMTANNGTFNGVVNASDGVFNGTVYASDGEFTGIIHASSGEFTGEINATSGTFAGTLNAATGTIDSVTATNLTINSGSVNIETDSATRDVISLAYENSSNLAWRTFFTPTGINIEQTRTSGDTYTTIGADSIVMGNDATGALVQFTSASMLMTDGTNILMISPSSNVAGLSYTEISTL